MTTNHTPKGYPPGPYIYQAKLTASENHKGFTVYAKSGTVPDGTGDLWIADVSPIDEDGIEGEAVAALFAAAPTQNNTLKLIQHFIHDWRNIARNALAVISARWRLGR